jgi:hypothetical protein
MALSKKLFPKAGGAAAAADDVIDIDNFASTVTTKDLTSDSIDYIGGLDWADSGSKCFIIDEYSTGIVYRFDASTAYDITAIGSSVQSLNLGGSYAYGCQVKNDGSSIFCNENDYLLGEYTMSSYNISSSSRSTTNRISRSNVVTAVSSYNQCLSMHFSLNGEVVYAWFSTSSLSSFKIAAWNLSTAWDVSGIDGTSPDSVSGVLSGHTSNMYTYGFWVNSDGSQIVGQSRNRLYQIDLSTAGDASTASVTKNVSVTFPSGNTMSFNYQPDANKGYGATQNFKAWEIDYTP